MIDPVVNMAKAIDRSKILRRLDLKPQNYAVLTLHRPSNVDSTETLAEIYEKYFPLYPNASDLSIRSIREHVRQLRTRMA